MENTNPAEKDIDNINETKVDPVPSNNLKDFVNTADKDVTKEGEKTFKEGLANNSDTKQIPL